MTHTFATPLWETESMGAWVFVTVPKDVSDAIRAIPRPPSPGFGSVRVWAAIGGSQWATSVFPDSKSGCYLLPVKKAVRREEGVEVGDTVEVAIEVLE